MTKDMKPYQRYLSIGFIALFALTLLTSCLVYEDNPYPGDPVPVLPVNVTGMSQTQAE